MSASDDGGETQRTTDHETIRRWAEARGGQPATVEDTMDRDEPGVLRFDFDGDGGDGDDDRLQPISWDAFFEAFEENDLAMLYQEEVEGGGESRFFKFVDRNE